MMRLLNSRRLGKVRHAVMSRAGFVPMESDVADVVYLTWLVDAPTARKLVPPGVPLWEKDGKTPFTILTYRHGHFGPALAGPLRRLFPSPLQSNWRLYLENPPPGVAGRTVYFLKNVMSSMLFTFGTRMFSDIMQTHLAARFAFDRKDDTYSLSIHAGDGSAPALACKAVRAAGKTVDAAFGSAFGSWEQAVDYLALQDVAVTRSDRLQRLVASEIELPIDVAEVLPFDVAAGDVQCPFLAQFASAEGPFCFVVPRVKFRVVSERVV